MTTIKELEARLAEVEKHYHPASKPMTTEEWNAKLAEERAVRRADTIKLTQATHLQAQRERLAFLRSEVPKLTAELEELEADKELGG